MCCGNRVAQLLQALQWCRIGAQGVQQGRQTMATQQGRYGIARAAVLVDEVGNGQQARRGGHKWPLLQLLHAMGAHVSVAAFQDQKTVVVVRGLIVIGVRCDDHRLPVIDAPAASTNLDLQRAANRQHHLHMGVAVAIPVTPILT